MHCFIKHVDIYKRFVFLVDLVEYKPRTYYSFLGVHIFDKQFIFGESKHLVVVVFFFFQAIPLFCYEIEIIVMRECG